MPVELINARGLSDAAHGLTIAALIIFFLYLAGVIVQPLAIAALLSFILAPVMRRLRIWGLPKVVSAFFGGAHADRDWSVGDHVGYAGSPARRGFAKI